MSEKKADFAFDGIDTHSGQLIDSFLAMTVNKFDLQLWCLRLANWR